MEPLDLRLEIVKALDQLELNKPINELTLPELKLRSQVKWVVRMGYSKSISILDKNYPEAAAYLRAVVYGIH